MSDDVQDVVFVLAIILAAAAVGFNCGVWLITARYQREAVKRGFAEPAKPAEGWKWKEPTK